MSRRCTAAVLTALLLLSSGSAQAGQRRWTDITEALLETARDHRRALVESIPWRERDVRAATASLDRRSTLYARGVITREELEAAARDISESRAQLAWAQQEIVRTDALIAEIEARRRLATLPPLRPGQFESTDALVRYFGPREFSPAELPALERFFAGRVGRPLPVSAIGQSDVHTRLGFDHRQSVDLALHPDSAEGRLVMAWLRERGFSFLAFRGARSGAATGAHIHVGRPSERLHASR
jgi:hypothetical protein